MSLALQPKLFGTPQTETTSDDYYTPAWVFERMGIEFDLDVASPPGGIPWIPASRHFTMEDDGLAQPWTGRVWMNPPYSHPGPWVRRFIKHHNGVTLVQVAKAGHSARLWNEADGIAFLGPIKFSRTDGRPGEVYMPVWFAAFGDECVEAISRLGRVR